MDLQISWNKSHNLGKNFLHNLLLDAAFLLEKSIILICYDKHKMYFDFANLVIILLVIFAGIIGVFALKRNVGRLFNKSKLQDNQSYAAILSFYSAGHLLALADRGTINGMKYSTYVTIFESYTANQFADAMAVIHVLDLPFNTDSHLIGLSKQHKIDRIKFGNFVKASGMEPVVLEGDFRDYFDLYAAKGQQIEVREVLAPDAMAFVVDYCKTHFWEINRSELYIVASDKDKEGGNIYTEAQEFVKEIKPALRPGDPGAPVVHHEIPYGEYDGPPLNCPICKKQMTSNNIWFTCPDGHGILVSGRELAGLRNQTVHIDSDASKATSHGLLTCPNCHNKMEEVDYDDNKITIDSCTNCPYRWLDTNEISKIAMPLEEQRKNNEFLNLALKD